MNFKLVPFFSKGKKFSETRWSSPLAYTSSSSRVKSLTVKEEPLFTEVISKVHLLRGKDFKQKAKSNVILFHKDENIAVKTGPLICYHILGEWLSKCIFPLHVELWQWNVSWRPTVLVKHQHPKLVNSCTVKERQYLFAAYTVRRVSLYACLVLRWELRVFTDPLASVRYSRYIGSERFLSTRLLLMSESVYSLQPQVLRGSETMLAQQKRESSKQFLHKDGQLISTSVQQPEPCPRVAAVHISSLSWYRKKTERRKRIHCIWSLSYHLSTGITFCRARLLVQQLELYID